MSNFFARYPIQAGGGGVTSLDGMTGAINLVAGTGISILDGVQTITISSTSAGDVTIGAFGSTPNANGLSISGSQVLNLQPADATHSGGLKAVDWVTFNSKQNALTLGNLTDAGTDGIVVTGGTGAVIGSGVSLAQHVADSTHNGYLSSTDWSTFNSKQASGNYITALTGDVTASGPGSVAATLATVNSNVGSFTNASITVDGKGRITAASSGAASGANTSLSNLSAVAYNTGLVADSDLAYDFGSSSKRVNSVWTNYVRGGSTAKIDVINSLLINTAGTTTADYSSATLILPQTTNQLSLGTTNTVTITAPAPASSAVYTIPDVGTSANFVMSAGNQTINGTKTFGTAIAIGSGGTGQTTKAAAFDALSPMTTGGDLIYGGASGTGTRLANGGAGDLLTSAGTTAAPTWVAPSAVDSASTIVKRGSSGSISTSKFVPGISTVATAAGTTTLTVASLQQYYFTGSSTQTIKLPVVTTLIVGWLYFFHNRSTGIVTIVSSGSNTILAMAPNSSVMLMLKDVAADTTAAPWDVQYTGIDNAWDANKNLSVQNVLEGYTTTATAAGTTTLTVSSTYQQFFTGSTTQTVVLPVASTLVLGQAYSVTNLSSGAVTVNSSGANLVSTVAAGATVIITCVLASGTSAASWSAAVLGASTFAAPTQQRFTSSSGTYTTPTSPRTPLYLKVRMVGGGGGGAATGTSPGAAGNGAASTFGSSLLTANGGSGGDTTGGAGYTINAPAYGTGVTGAAGSSLTAAPSATDNTSGGQGGATAFGGAGAVVAGGAGKNAQANTGSGGGGAGSNTITNGQSSPGGASGAFIDAIIPSPSATYSYAVGAAGAGATLGTGGLAGGNGAAGYIEVTEYYQ